MTNTARTWQQTNPKRTGIPEKSLMMLPQRYAIRCVDELGLILRAEIVWAKPNGLPESVTDRVRRSHEQVFHFVKRPRYYSAVDEIREPHVMRPQRRSGRPTDTTPRQGQPRQSWSTASRDEPGPDGHPLGKLPGSVWSIPTTPLRVPKELGIDHFAAYPPELVRRIVLGWSPREVCTACGEGRRPVVRSTGNYVASSGSAELGGEGVRYAAHHAGTRQPIRTATGWSLPKRELVRDGYACACPAPMIERTIEERDEVTGERVTRTETIPDPDWQPTAPATPGVVLDPFGGTGTTALVASVHGRVGISVDLSADYCRSARWRTTDEKQRAKVAGVKPKPRPNAPPPTPGQLNLFAEPTA